MRTIIAIALVFLALCSGAFGQPENNNSSKFDLGSLQIVIHGTVNNVYGVANITAANDDYDPSLFRNAAMLDVDGINFVILVEERHDIWPIGYKKYVRIYDDCILPGGKQGKIHYDDDENMPVVSFVSIIDRKTVIYVWANAYFGDYDTAKINVFHEKVMKILGEMEVNEA